MLNADPSKAGTAAPCCRSSHPGQPQQAALGAWRVGLGCAPLPGPGPPALRTAGCPQVSARAKKRGLPQMGTLGAGNHYAEIQVGPAAPAAPSACCPAWGLPSGFVHNCSLHRH